MISIIQTRIDQLIELCRRLGVKQLDLFGSAGEARFRDDSSDLDFLVTFEPCTPSEHYDRYFGLLEGLEELFGRKVDLVEEQAMRNPYFIREVLQTRKQLYAA